MRISTLARRNINRIRWRLAKPFRPTVMKYRQVPFRGMQAIVLANEDVGWRLIMDGDYEALELNTLCGLVRQEDLVFDIGANLGLYSISLARQATQGTVVAFEPTPRYQHLTALNAELNQIDNVRVVPHAVGDRSGEADFSVASDGAFSSLVNTGRKESSQNLTVPITTLDDAVAEFGRPNVLKIDVEGAELNVLSGGHNMLTSNDRPRAILVELCQQNLDVYGATARQIIDLMTDCRYSARALGLNDESMEQAWERASANVLFEPMD